MNISNQREHEELLNEINDLYIDMFDTEFTNGKDMSLDEMKDLLLDLSMKQPTVKNIKALADNDDLDYKNLEELSMDELLELQERLDDDIRYEE